MQTECSADLFGFAPVERRAVVAGFGGGRMTSDAGALLLGAADSSAGMPASCAVITLTMGCCNNWRALNGFHQNLRLTGFCCLRRRSQKGRRLGWDLFKALLERFPCH